MLIDQINLNHFRVFDAVFRTRSMTLAARELHLTQSGVSQHMKSLEKRLGAKLFDRINQRLVPTGAGAMLHSSCQRGLAEFESVVSAFKSQGKELRGTISVGMPMEFGKNTVVPLLAAFGKKHPLVEIRMYFGIGTEINQDLLTGKLDFAFIDEFKVDPRIHTKPIYDEVLELCAGADFLKKKPPERPTRDYYESLDYISYDEDELILRMWFSHHLGTRELKLRSRVMAADAQAVGFLILKGLGVGVLPSHLIAHLQKQGEKFYQFKGSGKPLKNRISLAVLNNRTLLPAAEVLMKDLIVNIRKNATQ